MTKNSSSVTTLLASLAVIATIGLAARARAQTEPPPAMNAPPPPASSMSRSGSGSAGGGGGAGIGVGAAAFLSGLAGAQVVYDQQVWHLEGMLAFDSQPQNGPNNPPRITTFEVGASGWYHLHLGASSDFSLGGGIGFISVSGGGSLSAVAIEPGAQARVFVTPNVAVHGRLGLAMVFGDNVNGNNPHILLNGQPTAGFGFTYFFR